MLLHLFGLAALLMQQPQPRPAPRAARADTPSAPLILPNETPRSAYDTAIAAVAFVSSRVADVRSTLDRYRLAVFNQADGEVVEVARLLNTSCRALADATRRAPRVLCLSCVNPTMRPRMATYKDGLPRLQGAMQRASATLTRSVSRTPAPSAAGLRRDFRPLSAAIVAALQDYERRLGGVLEELGGPGMRATPPRPSAGGAPARP